MFTVQGETPLHYAAGENSLKMAAFLLDECGADVDAQDFDNVSLLLSVGSAVCSFEVVVNKAITPCCYV